MGCKGGSPLASIGQKLRQAREAKGLTLHDVQQETKIRERYLEAIEADLPEELPAAVYVRGFIRSYARLVGLDPDEAVRLYIENHTPAAPEETPGQLLAAPSEERGKAYVKPAMQPPTPRKEHRQRHYRPKPSRILWVLMVVIVALAIGVGVPFLVHQGPSKPAKVRQTTAPVASPKARAVSRPHKTVPEVHLISASNKNGYRYTVTHGPISLAITWHGRCWIAVTSGKTTLFEGTLTQGTHTFVAAHQLTLNIGAANQLILVLNHQRLHLPSSDIVIPSLSITAP